MGPLLETVHRSRQPAMKLTPVRGPEVAIQDRREQRVAEYDRVALELDNAGRHRPFEIVRHPARLR